MRTPADADAPRLFQAIVESLTDLRAFPASMLWALAEPHEAQTLEFCRKAQNAALHGTDFSFVMEETATGELLGCAGLHRYDPRTPKGELGFWVRSSKHGRGFATDVARTVIAGASQHLGLVRITACVDAQNLAAQRVCEKAGMQLESTARNERRDPVGVLRATCTYVVYPTGSDT